MKRILILSSLLALTVNGCGGGGSSATELKTSYLTASTGTASLDADVVTFKDAALDCVAGNIIIPALNSVDVVVTSKAYPGTTAPKLDVRIDSATVTYTPIPTAGYSTPQMEPISQNYGTTLTYGGSVTIPVTVLRQSKKAELSSELCSGPIYHYNVKISINASEIGTDASGSAETAMQLNVANFAD